MCRWNRNPHISLKNNFTPNTVNAWFVIKVRDCLPFTDWDSNDGYYNYEVLQNNFYFLYTFSDILKVYQFLFIILLLRMSRKKKFLINAFKISHLRQPKTTSYRAEFILMIIKVYMEKPQVTTNCLLSVRLIRFSWQRISFLQLKIIFLLFFFN